MPNPNIVNPTNMQLWGGAVSLNTATEENLIGNSASSSAVMKVTIVINNIDGTSNADITIKKYENMGNPIYDEDYLTGLTTTNDSLPSGNSVTIRNTITVPADSSLEIGEVVLNEDQALTFQASVADDLSVQLTYVVIT